MGNYTAEVLDNQAHAWTEIYIDSVGWVPVEMTPGNKTGIEPVWRFSRKVTALPSG